MMAHSAETTPKLHLAICLLTATLSPHRQHIHILLNNVKCLHLRNSYKLRKKITAKQTLQCGKCYDIWNLILGGLENPSQGLTLWPIELPMATIMHPS